MIFYSRVDATLSLPFATVRITVSSLSLLFVRSEPVPSSIASSDCSRCRECHLPLPPAGIANRIHRNESSGSSVFFLAPRKLHLSGNLRFSLAGTLDFWHRLLQGCRSVVA